MKKLFYNTPILSFIFALICVFSCKHESFEANNEKHKQDITSYLKEGTWKIDKFYDDQTLMTDDFEEFSFTFIYPNVDDGLEVIDTNGNTNYGEWEISYEGEHSSGNIKLDIDLDGNYLFEKHLKSNWKVVLPYSEDLIELERSGGDCLLTFRKIK